MATPKAKLPYDLELTYHEKVREISEKITNGNKTQVLRVAIDNLYNKVIK